MRTCELDEIVFLPEQKPRGKDNVTDLSHRVALIEHAIGNQAGLRVARLVSDQFTVQHTLPELHRLFGDSRLTLLLGSDIARTLLYRWEGLDTLLRDVSLAIGIRSNDSPKEMTSIMTQLAQDYDTTVHYTLISTPEAGITSSQIRSGSADTSRLHPGTLHYIQKHKLYPQAFI